MTPPARRTQPARTRIPEGCRKLSCAGHFTHITAGLFPHPEQGCSAISEKRMKAPKTQMSKSMPPQGLGPREMAARFVIDKNMYKIPTCIKGLPDFWVSGTFGTEDPKMRPLKLVFHLSPRISL